MAGPPGPGSRAGQTLFISGASRGIGLAIALRWARDGGDVALVAKTAEPDPRLPGTVFTAAAEIEAAGGAALPVVGDIRDEESVVDAVARTVERFGGIDACVNNASAINLAGVRELPMKRYDLMQDVNTRGTYLVTRACLPALEASARAGRVPHVLALSPPLSLDPRWFAPMTAYTIAKYGMSMCVLGFARELAPAGIAVNALWPCTAIATAAVANLLGGEASMQRSRRPEIVADAAAEILSRPASFSGNFCLDEQVLAEAGITDLSPYRYPGAREEDLMTDFFLPGGEVH